MLGRLYQLVIVSLLISGCVGTNQPETSMTRHTLQHEGIEREYYVFEPPPNDSGTASSALIFLHGYGGTATGAEAETTNGLNRYAAEYGFVVVYPQGSWFSTAEATGRQSIVTSWNDLAGNRDDGPEGPLCAPTATRYPCPPECGDCGRCGWTSCHDDVGFLRALLQQVAELPEVDRRQVFIAGFSNGAMMAHRMGCVAADSLAGVVLVGGRLERGYQCAPAVPLPLLQINGGRDSAVPYDGALADSEFYYASAPQVATLWAQRGGCAQAADDWSPSVGSAVDVQCSARCGGTRRENINCLWPDGEHVWPGYPPGHGSFGYCVTAQQQPSLPRPTLCVAPDASVDVWGSRLMFEFFSRHRRAGG